MPRRKRRTKRKSGKGKPHTPKDEANGVLLTLVPGRDGYALGGGSGASGVYTEDAGSERGYVRGGC